jgi:hypothetical protein
MLIQMICTYSWFLLPALRVGFGDELEKVLVTSSIPGQEHYVIGRLRVARPLWIDPLKGVNREFAANNRFYSITVSQIIKFYAAK